MNSEVVFLNDGSFKLPYDLKEFFVKGMAYTVMLKVGEGSMMQRSASAMSNFVF